MRSVSISLIVLAIGLQPAFGQDDGTVTDIDGNVYQTVRIGDQLWMAENLRTSKYADGTPIANVRDDAQWSDLTTGAWAHYVNDSANETLYGKLYNWYAVADSSGLCPEGWHVPSDAEWKQLRDHLGGGSVWTLLSDHLDGGTVGGGKMKTTGTEYWLSPNEGATNESGFTALPGGNRYYNGSFGFQGSLALFWSSSENSSDDAWARGLHYGSSELDRGNSTKRSGFSVRCLRDLDPSTLSLADSQADSITATSASVSSQVLAEGGLAVTRRGVVWGETADPNLAANGGVVDAAEAGTAVFTVAISGLSPSTSYYARAFAINATDTAYSASVSFTTFVQVTVADIDGNEYKTVWIGDQLLMSENLRVTRYRDGSTIPNVTRRRSWLRLRTGAWSHFDNLASNEETYGKLYNWYAVSDSRGLCPLGWTVPTNAEWTQLSDYLGGESVAGGKMKATGTEHWFSPNEGATNESGFTALPGGGRFYKGFFMLDQGEVASFWSSSEESSDSLYWVLNHDNADLSRGYYYSDVRNGFSVRCLRDFDPSTLSLANPQADSITDLAANGGVADVAEAGTARARPSG